MKCVYAELNRECNLRCKFCSLAGRSKGNCGFEVVSAHLSKGVKQGYGKAIITGGEPLLDEQLVDLTRCARDLGFEDISLQTNGTLMTLEIAKELKKAGMTQVIVSIHSHIPEVVDDLMGGENVLKKQLNGLQAAHDAGIETFSTIVIVEDNYRHLKDYFEFMIEKFPFLKHFTLNFVDPVGRSEGNDEVVPRLSEVEPFLLDALMFLERNGRTYRVERVPLCYLVEFAENNTELRRILTDETNFVLRDYEAEAYNEDYFSEGYVYGDACEHCWMKCLCPGLKDGYAEIYGTGELYPLFIKPEKIAGRSGAD